jgi:hypothetical protein
MVAATMAKQLKAAASGRTPNAAAKYSALGLREACGVRRLAGAAEAAQRRPAGRWNSGFELARRGAGAQP